MSVSVLDGKVIEAPVKFSRKGVVRYNHIAFERLDGSIEQIAKPVTTDAVAELIAPGAEGRFYLHRVLDVKASTVSGWRAVPSDMPIPATTRGFSSGSSQSVWPGSRCESSTAATCRSWACSCSRSALSDSSSPAATARKRNGNSTATSPARRGRPGRPPPPRRRSKPAPHQPKVTPARPPVEPFTVEPANPPLTQT
jgi:hypothetical protein